MASIALYDQLDSAIDALLASPDVTITIGDPLAELLAVGNDLRQMPRPQFKTRLRAELISAATTADFAVRAFPVIRGGAHPSETAKLERELNELPTLFASTGATYPVHGRSLVTSFALHTLALGLVLATGTIAVQQRVFQPKQEITDLITPSDYVATPSHDARPSGGGGGGGDRDKLAASQGKLPKLANEQITPPALVIRNEHPQLAVPPSVVMQPNQLKMPEIAQLGDPLSHVVGPASNGTGLGGGIGSGEGGGVGSGRGPGVGPGSGGGFGGGVYKVGGGVSAPRAIFTPDPEYSAEARMAKYQGTVLLYAIIGPDGRPRELKVSRPLGMGLDQKALEAVRKWRFEPALKNGIPVAVEVNVEVNFHLY